MTRTSLVAGMLVVSLGAAAAQQADITNARVDTRTAGTIEQAIADAGGTTTDPVWVGWRVPMMPGLGDRCGTWSDGIATTRMAMLEEGPRERAPVAAPSAPRVAALEAGTGLSIWIRVVDGAAERLRAVSDDCPIDGGGRRLIQLDGIAPADSLRFLDTLRASSTLSPDAQRRLTSAAVGAIAQHAAGEADALLDRHLAAPATDEALRTAAATWTARARGARGLSRLAALMETSGDEALRRTVATAIAQSPQPEALSTLWRLASTDRDEHVRAAAASGYAIQAPDGAPIDQLTTRLAVESSDVVKRQIIRGIARRPADTGVPTLVNLARTSRDQVVRVEAVRALSRTNHPAAMAYLVEVLR